MSQEQIEDAVRMLSVHQTTTQPQEVSVQEAAALSRDHHFVHHVIKNLPILAQEEWKTLRVTENNMKEIARKHYTLISRDDKSNEVTTFTYSMFQSVPNGLIFAMYAHGKSLQEILVHLQHHLRYCLKMYNKDKAHYLEVVLPDSFDRHAFLEAVKPLFGRSMEGMPVLAEEIIIGEIPVKPQPASKL